MSVEQLIVLAVAAMIGLAILRVTRVRLGHTPLPEDRSRLLFQIAFVAVPPIVLGAVVQPATGWTPLHGGVFIPLYGLVLAGLTVLMVIAAVVSQAVAPTRYRRLLLLALLGSEGDPDEFPFDPPVTSKLAESMAVVDLANAVFPRGRDFADQVDRTDFHASWDALDAATRTLEGRIADDRRVGLGVASGASDTAADARSRLNTLRGIAVTRGVAGV